MLISLRAISRLDVDEKDFPRAAVYSNSLTQQKWDRSKNVPPIHPGFPTGVRLDNRFSFRQTDHCRIPYPL